MVKDISHISPPEWYHGHMNTPYPEILHQGHMKVGQGCPIITSTLVCCGTEWPCQKRVGPSSVDRGPWGQFQDRNMHNAGKDFVEEVVECRWRLDASEPAAITELQDRLEFKCRLRGWEPEARKRRINDLLDKHTGANANSKLVQALFSSEPPILLFLPSTTVSHGIAGSSRAGVVV